MLVNPNLPPGYLECRRLANFKPRRPDWRIEARHRETKAVLEVGAAWTNDDGSICLKFNEALAAQEIIGGNWSVRAWPIEDRGEKEDDS